MTCHRWSLERFTRQATLPASLLASRTSMITPTVVITHRGLDELLHHRCSMLDDDIERSFIPDYDPEMSLPVLAAPNPTFDRGRGGPAQNRHVQGLINGFVHQVPLGLAGERDRQGVVDLLRAPPLLQAVLHEVS